MHWRAAARSLTRWSRVQHLASSSARPLARPATRCKLQTGRTDVLRKLQHRVDNGHILKVHRSARQAARARMWVGWWIGAMAMEWGGIKQPTGTPAAARTGRLHCKQASLLVCRGCSQQQSFHQTGAHLSSGMEAGAASEEASCCNAARSCRDSSCMSACSRENCAGSRAGRVV